jgi:hypothetical protein
MKSASQSLLSLGETKLTIQTATTIGYDTQALGLMAVAVALIGVDVALMHSLGRIWWLPLIGLGASLPISIAVVSQPAIDSGQNLTQALDMDATEDETDELVLTSIAQAIDDNTESLEGKHSLVSLSTALVGLSMALFGIAQLLPALWETLKGLAS